MTRLLLALSWWFAGAGVLALAIAALLRFIRRLELSTSSTRVPTYDP